MLVRRGTVHNTWLETNARVLFNERIQDATSYLPETLERRRLTHW